jgi:hypothetical protein
VSRFLQYYLNRLLTHLTRSNHLCVNLMLTNRRLTLRCRSAVNPRLTNQPLSRLFRSTRPAVSLMSLLLRHLTRWSRLAVILL